MFQSLVITLREGVEAALIIGIVLTFLVKTGRRHAFRAVYAALGAAVLASLGAAYVVHRLEVTEDAYEGWLMLAGGIFVASMVAWMRKAGKRLKQDIETRLSELAVEPSRAATAGIFLFVFLMVFREGIEMVLFLAAVSFRSAELMNFIGGLAGLALAALLGVGFFKGSFKIDLRKFFGVTSAVLMVIAAQLLITGVHELTEGGFLPSSPREMALVGPIVHNDVFFFVVIIALSLVLLVADRTKPADGAALRELPGPSRRKAMAELQRSRRWKLAGGTAGFVIITLVTAEFVYSRQAEAPIRAVEVAAANGLVKIPAGQLADHKLHVFSVETRDGEVRLVAILDDTDTVRAALDACSICGAQGYYQDGRNVICRNCGAAIVIRSIGTSGGCNPIPFQFVIENNVLTISESELIPATRIFKP
jgi:high-affinity iron transporter